MATPLQVQVFSKVLAEPPAGPLQAMVLSAAPLLPFFQILQSFPQKLLFKMLNFLFLIYHIYCCPKCEEPRRGDHRASEIEYLFSVPFPLVGNLSELFETERKILDKPEMTEIRNCGRDRGV